MVASKFIQINPEESCLSFGQEALVLHNKGGQENGEQKTMDLKIITIRVGILKSVLPEEADDITFVKDALVFPCAGGTALEVLEVQLPGKKVVIKSRCFLEWITRSEIKEIKRGHLMAIQKQ